MMQGHAVATSLSKTMATPRFTMTETILFYGIRWHDHLFMVVAHVWRSLSMQGASR